MEIAGTGGNCMLRHLAIILALTLVAGCAGSIGPNYSGADAGWLVVSIRTTNKNELQNTFLDLRVRSIILDIRSKDGERSTAVVYDLNGSTITPRDFDNEDENGAVFVRAVPAGDYEIYNFSIIAFRGFAGIAISSKTDFSIPFSIQAGKASYVGSFKAYPADEGSKSLISQLFTYPDVGIYFVVTDESERDIPIARAKTAGTLAVTHAVPNVDQIGNMLLRSSVLTEP